MKAMLLAAGLGTRLKPWTDKHPKALAMVNGKSLLQRNIEYLSLFGVKDIVINVHHFADQIIDAIEKNNGWDANIIISDETGEVLETGGGLKKAQPFLETEAFFLLMNVDILTNLDLHLFTQKHTKEANLATLAVSDRNSSRYFLFDQKEELCGWKNVSTGEVKMTRHTESTVAKAFSGMHIISSRIFSLIKQTGKFSMVDVYLDLSKHNNIGHFNHTGAKFMDVGRPESIEKAEALFT